MHQMQTIVTDIRGVCTSVCQSVCHAAQLCAVHSCSLCQITLASCSSHVAVHSACKLLCHRGSVPRWQGQHGDPLVVRPTVRSCLCARETCTYVVVGVLSGHRDPIHDVFTAVIS